jgi:hypothetical protein
MDVGTMPMSAAGATGLALAPVADGDLNLVSASCQLAGCKIE